MYIETKKQAIEAPAPRWRSLEPVTLNLWRRHVIGRLSNTHLPGDRPDIFMFSSPRSGSTFVSELVDRDPSIKIIDEPLNARFPIVWRELNVRTWRDLTVMADRETQYARYFNRIRNNEIAAFNTPFYRDGSKRATSRIFYKIIHGGEDMVSWFESGLNGRILLLLRHPIATAASHWRLPRLPYLVEQPGLRAHLSDAQVALAERVIQAGDPFEMSIVDWCLQNFLLCRDDTPSDWPRISYEELVLAPDKAEMYLRERLDIDTPTEFSDSYRKPSKTVIPRAAETRAAITEGSHDSRRYLISKWRARVTTEQIDRAFELLAAFGVDYYGPDHYTPAQKYLSIDVAPVPVRDEPER